MRRYPKSQVDYDCYRRSERNIRDTCISERLSDITDTYIYLHFENLFETQAQKNSPAAGVNQVKINVFCVNFSRFFQ